MWKQVIAVVIALQAISAHAEVAFPKTRNAVGPDEIYLLETFKTWRTECLRDKNGEDICQAATTITDLDHGIELDFGITPYGLATVKSGADVDIAPRAVVSIFPYSSSTHYEDYSATILSIDSQPFDGYWCPLTDDTQCTQGPELALSELDSLMRGYKAQVAIYGRRVSDSDAAMGDPITVIDVPIRDLRDAYERARLFSNEIFGQEANPAPEQQACTFNMSGQQRRISYTYDSDFDAENTSLREILRGPRDGGDCPSYAVLAALTPDSTVAQRKLFCLAFDKEKKEYAGFQHGQSNAYGICKEPSKTFCERVNGSKNAAMAITGTTAASVGTAVGATTVAGTTVVAHSSGAAILTGSSGYVAGTLGPVAATIGVVTAPATVVGAAIAVIALGGAVYVCS